LKILNGYRDKELRKLAKTADKVLALEEQMSELSDTELKQKTTAFKARYQNGESLDSMLPEAFAVCREADWRVLGLKPYRVQVIGGIALHQGRIAQMKTGEGKTLVATLPAYLNAITGKGVHIVTVNDYLAQRDAEQMGRVYRFLGLSTGLIIHGIEPEDRKKMYDADITYGTNSEFGFDYLRDNMAGSKADVVQRGHHFAIVDEVDSILVDEARTPLIISGQAGKASGLYAAADMLAKQFSGKRVKEFDRTKSDEHPDADYLIDEKGKNVILTGRGIQKAEDFFGIDNFSGPENLTISHHVIQAVKANGLMKRDVDYVVKNGEIIIVDEFTGRLMYGRRYNDGLHQALEAKEKVEVANESMTYATVTFQNFFRLYTKLSGMTGTAMTEEEEFRHIYQLDVVPIPTNKPVIRKDHHDAVYGSHTAKLNAIVRQIKSCYERRQPVLAGTVSIEKSEELSKLLTREGIPHQVLNAKNHEQEAFIIAQAGRPGTVTIATNMAGRGTDIMLGGNPAYLAMEGMKGLGIPEHILPDPDKEADPNNEADYELQMQYQNLYEKCKAETDKAAEAARNAGGLFIIGTERHESRRIDDQLRGRSGRQGDPGESRFFLSLDDPLLRLFIPDGTMKDMIGAGLDDGQEIRSKMLSRAIETAQRKLEGQNFDIRKNVLQYDDILAQQRQQIYAIRRKALEGENLQESIRKMREWFLSWCIDLVCGDKSVFTEDMLEDFRLRTQDLLLPKESLSMDDAWMKNFCGKKHFQMKAKLLKQACALSDSEYKRKEAVIGVEKFSRLEQVAVLRWTDHFWMQHINEMAALKDGIQLQAYGQHDPAEAYKLRAYEMFDTMMKNIWFYTVDEICRAA